MPAEIRVIPINNIQMIYKLFLMMLKMILNMLGKWQLCKKLKEDHLIGLDKDLMKDRLNRLMGLHCKILEN